MTKVLFDPSPKQDEFHTCALDPKYAFVLFGGAIRGGKTFGGLALLIALSKMYKESKWVVVRKDLPRLKKTTIPSFNKLAPENFIEHRNNSEHIITFNNGSQIIFFAENFSQDPEFDRFKGLEVNGFLFEEINECQEGALTKAFERAGSHIISPMPKPLVIATCNPTQGWVKEKVYDPFHEGTLNPRWKYIQSKITDNPHIPEEYIQNLKDNMPYYEYEVFVEGNWDFNIKTGGEFYKGFEIADNTIEVEYDEHLPLHLSFDENVNPYLTCTVWQVDGLKAYQVDELCMKNPSNTVEGICEEIKRRFSGHKNGMFIYGDATSKKEDVKLQKGHNFFTLIESELAEFNPIRRVPSANPSVIMRGQFINHIFTKGFGGVQIFVGRKCKNSTADLINLKEAPDGTKFKKKILDPKTGVRYEEYGHTSDTMDYFLCEAFYSQYQEYQQGNDNNNYYIAPIDTSGGY
jgi:hypothetical protein